MGVAALAELQDKSPMSAIFGTIIWKVYEEMIQETATKDAPWYVVPADNKLFTRVVVAGAVVDTLANLDLEYP